MDNLFDKITNIRKENVISKIENSINSTRLELEKYGTNQLCKVYSRNLAFELNSNHINAKVYNLEDLINYDHEVVIVSFYKNNEKVSLLIDLTFRQFLHNDENLFENLINKGYFYVNYDDFNEYINFLKNRVSVKKK